MATAQAPERTHEEELQAAARAGGETADLVVGHQMAHGLSADQIDALAESVFGDRFDHPTEVSDTFYAAYDERAAAMVDEMRAEREADPGDIEAG